MSPPEVHDARSVSNGIPPPDLDLPYPDSAEVFTSNLLKLTELTPDPRVRFIFQNLVTKLHEFVKETQCVPTVERPLALSPLSPTYLLTYISPPGHRITQGEWMTAIEFMTRAGKANDPQREFYVLSSVLGVTALVEALNNPPVSTETESSNLGPFYTENAPDIPLGESIASEDKGEYLFVQGHVRDTSGAPIPGAVIESWETDDKGFYDLEYGDADSFAPDCRGRLVTDKDAKYEFRAVVPIPYPLHVTVASDELLPALGRHNVRPSHLHMMIKAPGFRKLITALYPEDDAYVASDPVFGVKKSLVVKLVDIDDEAETRRRGFPKGSKFKLLSYDFTLLSDAEAAEARAKRAK
ncbi:Intradiol ring-cleavage dioxygenase [Lactarius quietus]|nr:Intradiol ring-cleavage dioxygenase [Lactarius quietus]